MFAFREWVDAGGLLYRRAADYVDRIARGGKPSDLPVEQSTKFEFLLNLKTPRRQSASRSPPRSCYAPTRWSNSDAFCCTALVRLWHKASH